MVNPVVHAALETRCADHCMSRVIIPRQRRSLSHADLHRPAAVLPNEPNVNVGVCSASGKGAERQGF